MFSLPNLLTMSRIVVIPLVIATFYFDSVESRWLAVILFGSAAISDFFDGWLARRWNQVSALGRFLDPIADKLLVAAILMMLVGFGRLSHLSLLPAIIILCREILVSGLREFLAELRVGMPVTKLAKWKTTFQLVALPVAVMGDMAPWGIPARELGEVLLWIAAALTMITGYDYLKAGLKHMSADA
ncbi:CDP-diacylglycerol--glycerol-3-phosphate 3-phosphatidyltransferase [Insolitispirillum peregrinum]|uniref:CDP-diacylglycerol--glycerol-3-phosphate 3-phosphatidyltransferase n=1 Tax=Insolitispirillum peregrinum TaxID=80876 RepID=A0A1N7K2K0_9PROT|nr:CDP-diacylglycerol--glycerol-3-phosphate 3-phosphatidyltransferase [Insolitispirillum peregrinum]